MTHLVVYLGKKRYFLQSTKIDKIFFVDKNQNFIIALDKNSKNHKFDPNINAIMVDEEMKPLNCFEWWYSMTQYMDDDYLLQNKLKHETMVKKMVNDYMQSVKNTAKMERFLKMMNLSIKSVKDMGNGYSLCEFTQVNNK